MVQVNIPNLGIVNFPDDMGEADINREAQSLYDRHNRPQERTFGERITDALGTISPALARGSIQTGLAGRTAANVAGLVSNEDLAQEAARAAVRTQQYAPPENIQAGQEAIQRAGQIGAYEGAQAMMANPSAVFSSLVESIPAMAVMAGTGGTAGIIGRAALGQLAGRIGMMLGTGSSSYGMEFGQTVLQHIAESGVNIRDPQQLQQVLNDPLRMTEAINAAMRRATAVAAFDTASAGIAGRTIRPGQGLAQTLRGVGREGLEQTGLGMTGETFGQVAQHGRIQNYSDILMEGLGEVAMGGPMEIAAGALSTRPRAQTPSPTQEAPLAQEAPAEERAVTDPQLAREMLAERGVDHGTFSDDVAVAAANRLVQRVADEIPDIEARTQQYEQEVQALTGSTFDDNGKRRWNNAEYGRLQTRLDTLDRERQHIVDPKKLEKNQREIEKTQARLNALVNALDARFADIHQRPFEQKPSQTGISDLERRQGDDRPIIVDRQGQAYPENPLLHQQGRGAEPGLVRTGNAPPRMMMPVEVDTADRFGLRNLWASTDPEQASANAKMVGEVYGALAKKFDIPERAVGLGGELNLYNVRPSQEAIGDYTPGNKSIRAPADLTSTMVHEWVHALDNALGERAGTTWASLAKMPGELGDAWRRLVNNIVTNSPTFLNNSRRMGSAYWTDPREMLSRAIEASWADWFKGTDFAKDFNNKLRRMNVQPYPRGGELTRIKGALENFIRKLTVVPKKDPRMGHVFEPLVPGGIRNTEPTPGGPLLSTSTPGERLESGNGRLNARAVEADRGMAQAVPAAALRAQARKMERAEIESTLKPEGTAEVPTREPPEKVALMTPKQMEDFLKGRGTPEQRLGAFSGFWHTPLYLADKFPEFRPWMNALLSFARTRAAKMHSYLDTALPLTNASKQVAREVTRMAEAANSMGTMPTQNPDGSYTLTVGPLATKAYQTGHLNAPIVGSKPGDVITLRGEAAQAFTAMRKSLDTAYQDLIDSTLAKLGYPPGTTPKDIRAQARSLEGAAKRRMETAADVVEELLTKRKVAYIPQMRSGKARLIIMKPEIKNGKMEVGADGFPKTPIDSEAAADRTWSIPFDAYTKDGAFRKANAHMKQMRAKFPAKDGWVMFVREMNQDALRDSITPTERGVNLVENLANLFLTERESLHDEKGRAIDPLDDFLDKLGELKKRMGERGFKASLARRRDLPGWLREENYDTYLPSAVGAYLVRAANFISRNYHAREMQDAKNSLLRQKRQDLLAYVHKQEEDMASPQAFTNFVKSMAFNWFLGWRLSSAAVNLTQLPQTSFPYLSMAAGPRRGAMELLKSFKDVNRIVLPSFPRIFKGYTEENIVDWNKRPPNISENHWNIMRELRNEGSLSAVVTHEQSGRVASVVDDQYLVAGLRKEFGSKVQAVLKTMPLFFTMVEQTNRMATALAVLRLTDDPKVADRFRKMTRGTLNEGQELSQKELARIAVDRTQLLISDINRPSMMRGTLGGIATQFMQYPISIMEFWATTLRRTGLTSKEASRFLAPAVIGLLLTSGLWGVPGGQDANDLIRELSRRVGPIFGVPQLDIHREIEHYLQNVLKELGINERAAYGIPEVLFKGLPRLLGIDLSRRAAANFNVAELLFAQDPTRVLGPGGAMVINSVEDARGYLMHGHPYLAFSALMPMFARDMVKATEAWQGRGPISPATGNSRLPAGEELRWETGLLATGFTPTRIARSQEEARHLRYRPMQEQISYWNERLSDALADQMAAARRGNEQRAAASRQEFQSILREMREADQGRPPHERVLRPNTLSNVRQQARDKVRGPVEAAMRRLPQAERVEAQRNLDTTYPRSIR